MKAVTHEWGPVLWYAVLIACGAITERIIRHRDPADSVAIITVSAWALVSAALIWLVIV